MGPEKKKLGKYEKARKRSALAFSFAGVVISPQKQAFSTGTHIEPKGAALPWVQ